MPHIERRRHPRFPFHASGILHLAGRPHHGTVLDISLKGALFHPPLALAAEPGQRCHLDLRHAAGGRRLLGAARIACRHDDLLGLEFLSLDSEGRRFLDTLIEMNLAIAPLLERQLPALMADIAD